MNFKTRLLRGAKDASREVLNNSRQSPPIGRTSLWAATHDMIADAIENIPETLNAPELTYASAVVYFCDHRPDDKRIAKGAILRAPHPEGQIVTQVFLDCDHRPVPQPNGRPYGRRLLVSRFDVELESAFSGTDCIIVE